MPMWHHCKIAMIKISICVHKLFDPKMIWDNHIMMCQCLEVLLSIQLFIHHVSVGGISQEMMHHSLTVQLLWKHYMGKLQGYDTKADPYKVSKTWMSWILFEKLSISFNILGIEHRISLSYYMHWATFIWYTSDMGCSYILLLKFVNILMKDCQVTTFLYLPTAHASISQQSHSQWQSTYLVIMTYEQ